MGYVLLPLMFLAAVAVWVLDDRLGGGLWDVLALVLTVGIAGVTGLLFDRLADSRPR